jgi:hypothetical protein
MITHVSEATLGTTLPYEVEQFCNLLARIYMRCLQDQDPQVLARLITSTKTTKEGSNAAA